MCACQHPAREIKLSKLCLAEVPSDSPLRRKHPRQDFERLHRGDQDQLGGGEGQRQVLGHDQKLDKLTR